MGPRPRRLWWRAARVILACFAGLVLLVGAGLAVLHTDFGRDQLRALVVQLVGKQLNGELTVGRLEGSVFGPITLRDIVVADREGRPVLRADSLTVDYRILPLLDRHAHLGLLEVDGLEAELRRLPDGRLAVADLLIKGPPSEEPWSVTLADLRVLRSALKIEREPGVWGDEFGRIEIRGAVVVQPDALRVALESAAAEWKNRRLSMAAAGDLVVPKTGGLIASGVELTAGRNHLAVPYATWGPNARGAAFTADLSAAELARLWPDSPVRADARIAGFATQDPASERVAAHVFGGLGGAAVNVYASSDLARGASGSALALFWAGAQPHELVAGAPVGRLNGWIAGEVAGPALSSPVVVERVSGKLRGGVTGDLRGAPLSALTLRAEVDRRRLTAAITARVPGGTASADLAALLPERLEERNAIALERADLKADFRDVADLMAAVGQPLTTGPLEVKASASGRLDDLTATASLTSSGLARDQLHLGGLRAKLSVRRLDPGRLPGSATGDAEIQVDSIALGRSSYGNAHVAATVSDQGHRAEISFDAGGRDGLAARGELRALLERDSARVRFGALELRTRKLVWTGRGGRFEVSQGGRKLSGDLALSSPAGTVEVGADLTRSGPELAGPVRWKLDRIDLRRVLDELGRTGFSGQVSSHGEVRLPGGTGSAEASASQVVWQGAPRPIGGRVRAELASRRLRAKVEVDAGQLGSTVAELVVRTPAQLSDLEAWKRLRPAAVESVTARGKKLDLALLAHSTTGSEKAPTDRLRSALADFELQAGRALESGKLTLAMTGGQVAASPELVVPIAIDLEAELDRARLSARARADAGDQGKLDLEAAVAVPDQPFDPASWRRTGIELVESARVRLTDLKLDRLERLAGSPRARSLALTGAVQAEVTAGQGARSLTARVSFRDLRGIKLAAPLAGELTATAQPGSTDLAVSVRLARGPLLDGALKVGLGADEVRGFDLERLARRIRDASLEGQLRIPDQPVAGLASALSATPSVSGRLSGELSVRGTVTHPLLEARVQAPGFTAEGVHFDRLQLVGRYRGGPWDVALDATQSDSGRVALKASGASDGTAPLRVHLSTRQLRLSLFTPLWKRPGSMLTHLDGLVESDLDVSGTGERPIIDGSVRVRQGEARIARFLRPVTGAKLDLTFRRSQGELTLVAESRPGKLRLDATVNLGLLAQTRFSAALKGDNLPIEAGQQLVSIDGKVSATGARRGPMWDVQMLIERGLVVRLPSQKGMQLHDSGPLDDVVFVDAAGAAQAAVREELARAVGPSMRLRVTSQDLIQVRSDEARFVMRVQLTVTQVGEATSVDGNIEAVRGWVDVLGRRYDIERAWIVFAGEIPPDPQLDIRVSHQFTRQLVYVDVFGRLSEPNMKFASDTGTGDEAELVGLILGGESPGEVGTSEKTLSQKAAGGAFSLAASRLAGAIRGAGLPVDVLQVGTDLESESRVTNVTVGKWLTERFFVAYRRHFGEEDLRKNRNEAIIQHFFARHWMWEGTGGDSGATTIDLLWIVPL